MAVRKTKKKVTEADLVPTKDRQVSDETLRSFGKRNMKKYATETNEERALPDLFDGLKPVQRRILWTMSQHPRNEFVKAARTVGDALGKYHPHGDCLSGDTLVYTLDGKFTPIQDMLGVGKKWVLAYDPESKNLVPALAHSWRIGQNAKKTYRVELSDGSSVEATGNHQFYVRKQGWTKTEDLCVGDEFLGGSLVKGDYLSFRSSSLPRGAIHTLVSMATNGDAEDGEVVHHDNEQRWDNRPKNLKLIDRSEHQAQHLDNAVIGLRNGRRTMKSLKYRKAIRKKDVDSLIRQASPSHGLFVTGIEVIRHETRKPMYDFTVDGYENMLIATKDSVDRATLVVAHNSSVYGAMITMNHMPTPLLFGRGNWGNMVDGAAAYRYCFTGDTRVITEKGILPFSKLRKLAGVAKDRADTREFAIKVATLGDAATTSHVLNSGRQKTVKVTTVDGYSVECTPNEPFLTLTEKGYRWKLAEDLSSTDWLCMKRDNGLTVVGSHKLDCSIAAFLGYMVGDGFVNVDQNYMGFNQVDREVFDDFVECAAAALPEYEDRFMVARMEPRGYGKQPYYQWSLASADARRVVRARFDLRAGTSYDRRIPRVVWEGSKEFAAAFLSALFEADGSSTHQGGDDQSSTITLDSVSGDLLNDVSVMLRMHFGIFATIPNWSKGTGGRLHLTGEENVRRFVQHVGFRSKRKNEAVVVGNSTHSVGGGNRDVIPFAREIGIGRDATARRSKLVAKFYRGELAGNQLAEEIVDRDYFYQRVGSVEEGRRRFVYDLTVPSNHSFVANGFIVHNTNARLSTFGYLFFDSDYINKEVTSFVPNYDDKDVEPVKLPAMLPYVLMTGNEGVGVGITGKLPAFTAESLVAVLKRMLDGEKLLPKDYASTLKYAHKWGGIPVNSKENKEQWLRLFTGPEANVKFMSDATIDHDRKRIHISDWPQGTNLQKFMDKVRAMKETLRIESTKKSANLTIVCKPVYNMPQFEAYAQRVLKATHTSIAFKLNVTRRTASVVDGKTVYNNEVQALSVPEMLQAWLKERVQLELSSLAYRKRKQEAAIAYSELLIFACDKLDIIFKALRAKDADQFLIRSLKITEEQARQILELRVRQLSKLDQDALKLKLKEQRKFLRQLESWAKRPRAKIKADLDGVLEAINKDRNFKDKVDNQKLTLV